MKSPAFVFGLVVLLIIGIVTLTQSAYVIREGEQAVVTEFGDPVGDTDITEPGLHFKVPFTQKVRRFQKRTLEWDSDPNELVTKDKKLIYIDTFARWRIDNPRKFLKSVTTEAAGQSRLDDIIDSATRTAIANYDLIEAVRNSNKPLTPDAEILAARKKLAQEVPAALKEAPAEEGEAVPVPVLEGDDFFIEKGREQICAEILADARRNVGELGIELIDVQVKHINYVTQVEERVVERMISDRQQIAEMLRSEGEERRQELLGEIDREKNRILSEAYKTAEEIRGEAEAEAARIYAEAYGKDPEFYRFWKTLGLYQETLDQNATLVLGTDSDLFRMLREGAGTGVVPAGQ